MAQNCRILGINETRTHWLKKASITIYLYSQQKIIYARNSQNQLDFLIYDTATLDTICADATRDKKRCKIKKKLRKIVVEN